MAVLGVAKANFPQIEVDDRMKLAATPGARSLARNGRFRRQGAGEPAAGTVEYNGADLSISGEAESFASYKAARSALRNLPQGVRLPATGWCRPRPAHSCGGSSSPAASSYCPGSFLPSRCAPRLSNGHAALPRPGAVVDRMDTAAGAPRAGEGAAATLEQLAHLTNAKAEIKDRSVSISGQASDAGRPRRSSPLRAGAPAGFEVTDAFTMPRRRPRRPACTSRRSRRVRPGSNCRARAQRSGACRAGRGCEKPLAGPAAHRPAADRRRCGRRLRLHAGRSRARQAEQRTRPPERAWSSPARPRTRPSSSGCPRPCARLPTNPAKPTSGSRSRRRLWCRAAARTTRARSRCGRRRSSADRNRRDRAPAGRRRSLPG